MTTGSTNESLYRNALSEIRSWWPELRVIMVCLILLLSVAGLPPLYTRGEAREALVAFDMFINQHFILPDGYGGEIPSKPPLLHWLISIVAVFTGMNEFAVRAPSGIFAALFLGFYFGILRRLRSDFYAYIAVGLLLFSLEWLRAATTCRVDLVHSSCLATGWLCYFMLRDGGGGKWWSKVGCAAIAGAFLSKGPVAVLLAVFIISVWEFFRWRRVKTSFKEIVSLCLWFVVIPSIISALWYCAAYFQGGDAFTDKFVEENLSRFAGTMKNPAHNHHWSYLIGTGFLGMLPWSLLAFPAVWHLRGNLKLPTDFLFRFALLSAVLVFLFYSLPSSKRGVYLLVSYPFWIIVALDIGQRVSEPLLEWTKVFYRYLCYVVISLYFVIGISYGIGKIAGAPYTSGIWQRYPLFVSYVVNEVGAGSLGGLKCIIALLPLLWAIASVFSVVERIVILLPEELRGQPWIGIKVAILFSLLYLIIQGELMPVVGAQSSGRVFAKTIVEHVGTEPIASFGQEFYSLSYYSHRMMKTKEKPFFFDEWVVLAQGDITKLKAQLGDGQGFEVRASEPPFLKNGKEVVLGRIVRLALVEKNNEILKKSVPMNRY